MNLDFDWGKYTLYVGASFGLTALILGWMIVDTLLRARRERARFEALDKDRQA